MFTRPDDQSTRIRRVPSTAGACRSSRRAVPSRAICRGRCVRERPGWRLRRVPRASGWSRPVCRRAALRAFSYRHSPLPFPCSYRAGLSSGITSLPDNSAGIPPLWRLGPGLSTSCDRARSSGRPRAPPYARGRARTGTNRRSPCVTGGASGMPGILRTPQDTAEALTHIGHGSGAIRPSGALLGPSSAATDGSHPIRHGRSR